MKNKIKIGAIMGNLDAPHAYEVASGMVYAAEQAGAHLFFFPGMFAKSFYDNAMIATTVEYDYQNTAIFDNISAQDVDILIISLGTIRYYMNLQTEVQVQEFLHKFDGIPCIILEDSVAGYPSITINNKAGLYECLKHLIVDHGYKKIGFVSGNNNNFDAKERLGVYHSIMKKYGLNVDSSMIGYGEFTEYVDEIVGKMIDANPDIEAIAFANDMMAVGGYREIKRRGLIVGKDIAVTGFDDYIGAMSLIPPLTTVRVSPYQLGVKAIEQAIKVINGETIQDMEIPSVMVQRNSCGCEEYKNTLGMDKNPAMQVNTAYVNRILAEIVKYPNNQVMYAKIKDYVEDFVYNVMAVLEGTGLEQSNDEIIRPLRELLMQHTTYYVAYDKLFTTLNQFMQSLLENVADQEVRSKVIDAFISLFGLLTNLLSNDAREVSDKYKKESWYATFLTRDTMMYWADEAEALRQILVKLQVLQFPKAHLYLFDEPHVYRKGRNVREDALYLAAYFNDGEVVSYRASERKGALQNDNADLKLAEEKGRTFVTYNLFANEEQYGFITFETELKNFSFAYTISLQIGTALKFLHLMRKQMRMQKKLESTLEDVNRKNDLLSQLSVKDEMTGLYNRRGLFEMISNEITEHEGQLAAIVFIDMDNLKSVNDIYGHGEGDYALRSIANILKQSFREQDYVGRIGGDEFAAFAIVDEPELMHQIKSKIHALSEILNDTNEKPYYVEVSLGIKEFICRSGMNFDEVLKEADEGLYHDKKNKRINIEKKSNL